jgi:hypothetical protein
MSLPWRNSSPMRYWRRSNETTLNEFEPMPFHRKDWCNPLGSIRLLYVDGGFHDAVQGMGIRTSRRCESAAHVLGLAANAAFARTLLFGRKLGGGPNACSGRSAVSRGASGGTGGVSEVSVTSGGIGMVACTTGAGGMGAIARDVLGFLGGTGLRGIGTGEGGG